MDTLNGEVRLDEQGSGGTLRLRGSGSDSFGGDFGSLSFDVTGSTYPIVL